MNNPTIRELGGEVWAEIFMRKTHGDVRFKELHHDALGEIIDLIMGVLARHKGAVIEDDGDLPVTPLAPHLSGSGDPEPDQ